ncbi:MAG: hypothetical protein R2741_11245 [Methanolobus sp.]
MASELTSELDTENDTITVHSNILLHTLYGKGTEFGDVHTKPF